MKSYVARFMRVHQSSPLALAICYLLFASACKCVMSVELAVMFTFGLMTLRIGHALMMHTLGYPLTVWHLLPLAHRLLPDESRSRWHDALIALAGPWFVLVFLSCSILLALLANSPEYANFANVLWVVFFCSLLPLPSCAAGNALSALIKSADTPLEVCKALWLPIGLGLALFLSPSIPGMLIGVLGTVYLCSAAHRKCSDELPRFAACVYRGIGLIDAALASMVLRYGASPEVLTEVWKKPRYEREEYFLAINLFSARSFTPDVLTEAVKMPQRSGQRTIIAVIIAFQWLLLIAMHRIVCTEIWSLLLQHAS